MRKKGSRKDDIPMTPVSPLSSRNSRDLGRFNFAADVPEPNLFDAVYSKDATLLKTLLENSECSVEEVNDKGKRLLHVAAEIDNVDAVKLLIQHRANVLAKQKCFFGLSAVHIAASHGSVGVLEHLLTWSAEQGSTYQLVTLEDKEGSTALHWAVQRHKVRCVESLLKHGAPIDHKQHEATQSTPVHLACGQGSMDLLEMMAEAQPSEFKNTLTSSPKKDFEHFTPVQRAALLNAPTLLKFLVGKGGSVSNNTDDGTMSALHLAASTGAWGNVDYLLGDLHLDPFETNSSSGRHLAHEAAIGGMNLTECDSFVRYLENNPDKINLLDILDQEGFAAVHYAAMGGVAETLLGLLDIGANPWTRSGKGKTLLHFVVKLGSLDLVQKLLARIENFSVYLNVADVKGRAVYHIAARYGHEDLVSYLIKMGAVCAADNFGWTPLHFAAANGSAGILQSIFQHCASCLNKHDHNGMTALHLAAQNNKEEAVKCLLLNGSKNSKNNEGVSAFRLAVMKRSSNAALAFVQSEHWKDYVMQAGSKDGPQKQKALLVALTEELPDVMKACLDRCITNHEDEFTHEPYVKYDFELLHTRKAKRSAISFQNDERTHSTEIPESPMAVMKAMSRQKHYGLLMHPVVQVLLEQKWRIYGCYTSCAILLANIVFVFLLTWVTVQSVNTELRPFLYNTTVHNVMEHHPDALKDTDFDQIVHIASTKLPTFNSAHYVIMFIFALTIVSMKEVFDLISEGLKYFRDWTNYVQIVLVCCCIGFVRFLDLPDRTDPRTVYLTYDFAAISIFLAYLNLLRFFRPFGSVGMYSVAFFAVFRAFFMVFIFFSILIFAFGISYNALYYTMIFPDDPDFYDLKKPLDPEELQTTMQWLPTAFMRVVSWLLGDLETVDNFSIPFLENKAPFRFLWYIFYWLGLTIMSFFLFNVLLGLAVVDMQSVRRNATAMRLLRQVALHENLEKTFPFRWVERIQLQCEEYRFYPGRTDHSAGSKVIRWLAGGTTPEALRDARDESKSAGTTEVEKEREQAAATKKMYTKDLRKRVHVMDDELKQMHQLIVNIFERVEDSKS
ncbi:hypothetical protein RvY_02240 [Ramazzottius varieornatus]|uniref:Ion transport domain-containing protein n=1 Tax=Ramazzottius varieornatus TaxID=947166 RepID=A0A1D1UJ41_RAMVA|nr:hypothetical protein RvY_02240 [Ramazzottius varieornatus]